MPDQQQIFAGSVAAAPKDYVVGSNVEMILKAVTATFTDNGAASDWLPTVELISDSGHVIARALDQGVKVTAGDDAEVSWFPGVKRGTSSVSPVTGSAVPWGFISRFNIAGIADSTNTIVQLEPSLADALSGSSADGDITFGQSGINWGIQFNTNGLFLVFGEIDMNVNVAPAAFSGGTLQMIGNNFPANGPRDAAWIQNPRVAGNYRCVPGDAWVVNLPAAFFTPPVIRTVQVTQNSGAATNTATASFLAIRLDDVGSENF